MDWTQNLPTKYIVATIVALFIGGTLISKPSPKPNITDAGYYKSPAKERIYSQLYTHETTAHEIEAHANQLLYTSGSMTAAYYYPAKATAVPHDGLTLAKNTHAANHLLYEKHGLSKWRYAYMRDRLGTTTFVDCHTSPQHDLCRQ